MKTKTLKKLKRVNIKTVSRLYSLFYIQHNCTTISTNPNSQQIKANGSLALVIT